MQLPNCSQPAVDQMGDAIDGPITTLVVVFGLLGNLYSMRVLSRTSINASVTVALSSLAIWDVILLASNWTDYGLSALLRWTFRVDVQLYSLTVMLNGMIACANTASTWMLIYVTAQRFAVVSFPFNFLARRIEGRWSLQKRRRQSVLAQAVNLIRVPIAITVMAGAITLPASFEYHLSDCIYPETGIESVQIEQTRLLQDPIYNIFYRTVFLTILKTFGPFTLITVLTIATVTVMRNSMAQRARILIEQGQDGLFMADRDRARSLHMISMLLLGKFVLLRFWPTLLEMSHTLNGSPLSVLSRTARLLVLINSVTNCAVFVILKSAFESRRLRRARRRQRILVAQHAEQVLQIGKRLAEDRLFLMNRNDST